MKERGQDISNDRRPAEYGYWMIGIGILCSSAFIASLFPTVGEFIDYFFISLITAGLIWLIIYAVREVIKEHRFWKSKSGDKDYYV